MSWLLREGELEDQKLRSLREGESGEWFGGLCLSLQL